MDNTEGCLSDLVKLMKSGRTDLVIGVTIVIVLLLLIAIAMIPVSLMFGLARVVMVVAGENPSRC